MSVRERDIPRLLTLERQFCVKCWSEGRRERVINVAERVGRSDGAYKALRRRRLEAHLAAFHAESVERAVWGDR